MAKRRVNPVKFKYKFTKNSPTASKCDTLDHSKKDMESLKRANLKV